MRLSAPNVRIVDVETCDFALMGRFDSRSVLRAAHPGYWRRYLESAVPRRLIEELGVTHRYLTHCPGQPPVGGRLNAEDLARSAVERLRVRQPAALARLDALIFVSTSNPNPCNSQASRLAEALGLRASCYDIKAGCSGGVLGLVQAALLIQAGCERVLVVMAENLSHLTPPEDLRMLLTVGDGAACVLLERCRSPGFLAMVHGSAPKFASAIAVRAPFPPLTADARYVYESHASRELKEFVTQAWWQLAHESLRAASLGVDDIAHWFVHQTHAAQVDGLLSALHIAPARATRVVDHHGNMGTPTFAVAMARAFGHLRPGDRYMMQAVGGGLSWCSIVAVHT